MNIYFKHVLCDHVTNNSNARLCIWFLLFNPTTIKCKKQTKKQQQQQQQQQQQH